VINSYAASLEIELTRVTAITTTAQAQAQAQPGTLGAAPTSGTSKKVEVFADPGNFSGEINHFEEWWLKMKIWLNINQQTIPTRSYDAVVSVLSRMKQKAGTFSAQRLEKGIAYTWAELETDIVKQYRPTARPDWARRKLWSLKQGNTRSCNYVDLFTKYFKDAEIGHSHAIDILEQNINAKIRDQIVREEKRSSTDVHVYPKIDPKPADLVPKTYHQYLKVFSKKESERMPMRKPWDHAIDLKETFKSKKGRLIPLSPKEQKEVSDFIDDQLSKKYIRPSKSEQTSPVFFVPKKDGRKRMVQDYRYLNEHTVKNNYPLPLISQLVDKLKGSKWFTKIDLRWGYNNVCIKEGDEWKAAFVCHRGSFEPVVMYFGLCNSPATFQTMMNEIFSDMADVMVIYIDDLMIYTKTDDIQEHERLVKKVLKRLEEHDLFAKPEKCTFGVKEVEFLGMIVSREGIKMDDSKVNAIREWPTPKTVRGVRSFLGLANFYCRFIEGYAQVTRPLNDLTKKNTPFA
jgi:hypothetical protein